MAKKKDGRGGRREGSGRKREFDEVAKVTIVLEAKLLAALDQWCADHDLSRSQGLRKIIADATKTA